MIATLDTNVLVSAAAFGRIPRTVVEAAACGRFTMALSAAILDEYRGVLNRTKFAVDERRTELLVSEIREISMVVEDDPDDNAILQCAVESGSDYIVSGDRHLLSIGRFEGIEILSARAFLNVLECETAT